MSSGDTPNTIEAYEIDTDVTHNCRGSHYSDMNDETIEEFRPAWAAWFWPLLLTVGLALPYVWWQRRGTRYEVTESRVIRHTGRVTSSTNEFQLDRVTRIKTHQSLSGRLFGVGSITLDAGIDEMTLTGVPDHEAVADAIREAQE